MPAFPPAPHEEQPAALRVTREGAWSRVTLDATQGQALSLVAHAYPPEPFGVALEVESEQGLVHSHPGLDRVAASGEGRLSLRVRLRAGQRLALQAHLDGAPLALGRMSAEGGAAAGTLELLLPGDSMAGRVTDEQGQVLVSLRREYPGLPMEPPLDLTDADLRLLSRLGPNE